MMKKTITRVDLANSISKKFNIPRKDSILFVKMVLDEICNSAVLGEDVKLSSFATFHVRGKCRRIGRNPKSGIPAEITPRRVMTFRASNILKKRIIDSFNKHQLKDDKINQ
ncbi:MAG: integration host factor subunit alpha [Candidatus Liberibacter europaeus]|uniref:Integration host factor subunit alpha n=1 Tax=Candidatus Liberibacter europaeus TaxID=744859 RepID=A0A2T4VY04_9HYPH|nr:integration host factor subunit alpha [Candidatus Liberibacter europaeus]PTL86656.1 MAG: integration host factor subunit alpha [Candidatus Liberibacter europaeus]